MLRSIAAPPPRAEGKKRSPKKKGFSGDGKKPFFSDRHNDFIKSPPPPREKAKSGVAVRLKEEER